MQIIEENMDEFLFDLDNKRRFSTIHNPQAIKEKIIDLHKNKNFA